MAILGSRNDKAVPIPGTIVLQQVDAKPSSSLALEYALSTSCHLALPLEASLSWLQRFLVILPAEASQYAAISTSKARESFSFTFGFELIILLQNRLFTNKHFFNKTFI